MSKPIIAHLRDPQKENGIFNVEENILEKPYPISNNFNIRRNDVMGT